MHPISEITRNILRTDGRSGGDPRGKVHLELEDIYGSDQPKTIRIDLYNYGIDGNLPRPEHKQWIQAQLLPFLRQYRYHVKLYGRASRSGGEQLNYRVSRQRVLLLKEHLVVECGLSEAQVPGSEMQHHSSQYADRHDHESERDRCVRIVLSPGWKTRPMRIQKVRIGVPEIPQERSLDPKDWNTDPEPDKPIHVDYYDSTPTRPYRIRYHQGLAGGFIVGGEVHQVEIMDPATGDSLFFDIRLVGGTTPGVSYTPPSNNKWVDFKSNAANLERFNGRTVGMVSFGIGPFYSWSKIKVLGCTDFDLDTGTSITDSPWPGGSFGGGELVATPP